MLTLPEDAGAAQCPNMWILEHIFFGISDFLEENSNLSHSVVFLYFFAKGKSCVLDREWISN